MQHADDVDPLQRSELLAGIPGLVHGFTTRRGGVSQGRFATLNLGQKWGDEAAAVEENLRRVAQAAPFALDRLVRVRQVHGCDLVQAAPARGLGEADGLWCRSAQGLVVGVMTADCVPLLLADREGRVAAAVHSGWRGTVAEIAVRAVSCLVDAGVSRSSLVAAIGPCIEQPAFEVGPEVAERFDPRFVDSTHDVKPHIDLVGVISAQLECAGLAKEAIEKVGACTHANPDLYFSYRRDGAGIGQMLSFAGFA